MSMLRRTRTVSQCCMYQRRLCNNTFVHYMCVVCIMYNPTAKLPTKIGWGYIDMGQGDRGTSPNSPKLDRHSPACSSAILFRLFGLYSNPFQ